MDKDYLFKTARQLKPASAETAEEYRKKSDELIAQMKILKHQTKSV